MARSKGLSSDVIFISFLPINNYVVFSKPTRLHMAVQNVLKMAHISHHNILPSRILPSMIALEGYCPNLTKRDSWKSILKLSLKMWISQVGTRTFKLEEP